MSYHCIVFVSTATIEFGEAELLKLLTQAWALHQEHGITGMMAYSNGRFLQVLEGSQAAVQSVYNNIAADLRHGKLEKLADGPVPHREFAEWHMGFATPPGSRVQLPGFLPLVNLPAAGQIRQLLHDFLALSEEPVR
ncbi:hypothetical protein GO988_01700 [Hymenobacter sp. HMF4947]|uniref:BLUF domain-containing protein n=1 Tax=Hymenobacter ginkgonis TaxID=2682976 RepID=A0A7K1T9F9_9BACT|nr:BLUF domain-containing protein [Hymenobacter ginkgonis]MVN75033.1 hypothetical protein [Hymenobacter ginkgonis]